MEAIRFYALNKTNHCAFDWSGFLISNNCSIKKLC